MCPTLPHFVSITLKIDRLTTERRWTWIRQRDEEARERVQALKGFYVAAVAYVPVNIMLFVIDILTPGGPWFFWPLLGWGLGLGLYALNVFGGIFGRGWEERKIRELMDRDR